MSFQRLGRAPVAASPLDSFPNLVNTKGHGFEHKIPDDVSFVYCQLEACVIGKRNRHVEGSRPGLPGHDFPGRR